MTATIKTIIFDFGNVIGFFDYGPALRKLREFTALSEEDLREALDASELPDEYESGRIDSDEFLIQLRKLCQVREACDREALISIWCSIFSPNQAICDLVPRLESNYRLLLGSNTNELHALHFRKQFAEVFQHFDELVLSYQVGAMKPKPQFFQRCHELARCEPQECVFIDDLPANIAGARQLGLKGIIYQDLDSLTRQLTELGVRW